MIVFIDTDRAAMTVTDEDDTQALSVAIRLLRENIMSSRSRRMLHMIWEDLRPLHHLVASVRLETTAENVKILTPFIWLFPMPLEPMVYPEASTI